MATAKRKTNVREFHVRGELIRPSLAARALAYFRWVFDDTHFHGTEVSAVIGTFICGFVLVLPFDTFSSAPSYNGLAAIAPEPVWAAITLSLPVLAALAGGFENYALRLAAMLAHVFWYLFVGVLVVAANPIGWGYIHFVMSGGSAWAFYRLGREWETRAAGTRIGRLTETVLARALHAEAAGVRVRIRIGLAVRSLTRARR